VIYLLDTNAISALMRADTALASWLSSLGADERVVTCAIVRGEILFGIERLAPGGDALNWKERLRGYSRRCHVSLSRQRPAICMQRSKAPNNAVACRSTKMIFGLHQPLLPSTQRWLVMTVTFSQ